MQVVMDRVDVPYYIAPMNNFRSLAAAAVTALFAAVITLAGAAPAHAATVHSVTVTLTDGTTPGCNATTAIATSQTVVYASPGDTLRVVFDSTGVTVSAPAVCGFVLTPDPTGLLTGWVWTPSGGNFDFSGSNKAYMRVSGSTLEFTVGAVNVDVNAWESGVFISYGLIFRVVTDDRTVDETPPDFVQQFAISSGGTCESIPDGIPLFNVSRSGGWGKSWAQWPNDGQGGFVCTRTVRYEPSIQGWVPRA
jgi:hypothetical protein